MKTSITSLLASRAAVFAVLLSVSACASAGQIFKCTAGNRTTYQDSPCEGGAASVQLSGDSEPKPVEEMSVAELFAEVRTSDQRYRDLSEGLDRDIRNTKQRLVGNSDPQLAERENARIKAEWQPKLLAANERSDRLMAEIRVRCPGGGGASGGAVTCQK